MNESTWLRNKVPVKIKRLHPDAVIPRYATELAAGFDLVAVTEGKLPPGEHAIIPTGIAVEIPEGYGLFLFARSGHAAKYGITLSNAVGVVDADFRGEIKVLIHNTGSEIFTIEKGMRIAQGVVMPVPSVEIIEVNDVSETKRGGGAFGSTGNS